MTRDEIEQAFERHDDEYLKHERIENPRHPRPDICAFLMLHDLMPKDRDIIQSASHDEIWLDGDLDELAKTEVTEEQIRDLVRCGVRVDREHGGGNLCMFA